MPKQDLVVWWNTNALHLPGYFMENQIYEMKNI